MECNKGYHVTISVRCLRLRGVGRVNTLANGCCQKILKSWFDFGLRFDCHHGKGHLEKKIWTAYFMLLRDPVWAESSDWGLNMRCKEMCEIEVSKIATSIKLSKHFEKFAFLAFLVFFWISKDPPHCEPCFYILNAKRAGKCIELKRKHLLISTLIGWQCGERFLPPLYILKCKYFKQHGKLNTMLLNDLAENKSEILLNIAAEEFKTPFQSNLIWTIFVYYTIQKSQLHECRNYIMENIQQFSIYLHFLMFLPVQQYWFFWTTIKIHQTVLMLLYIGLSP